MCFSIIVIFEEKLKFVKKYCIINVSMDIADIQEASGYLYNVLLSLGVVIAVIVATILGIQFMLSEAEGQAKVKEMLIPFVIGCIVVFGGFEIWKIALTIGQSI